MGLGLGLGLGSGLGIGLGLGLGLGLGSHPDPDQVRHELGTKGLPSVAHELKIRDLSGGQKARIALP